MRKRIISTALIATLLVSSVQASKLTEMCEKRNGSWQWDVNASEWQCLNTNNVAIDMNLTAAEIKEVEAPVEPQRSFGTKVFTIVAAPVVAVGAVVYFIVVTPFYLVGKLFGAK